MLLPTPSLAANMQVTLFLNARHYVRMGGQRGNIHSHSWHIAMELDVAQAGEGTSPVVPYTQVHDLLQRCLAPYQGKLLNELPPFDELEPFTENIAQVLLFQMQDALIPTGVTIESLSLWEGPTKGITLRLGHNGPALQSPVRDLSVRALKTLHSTPPAEAAAAGAQDAFVLPEGLERRGSTRPRALPALGPVATPRPLLWWLSGAGLLLLSLLLHLSYWRALPTGAGETGAGWWLFLTAAGGLAWLAHTPYLGLPMAATAGLAWVAAPFYRLTFDAGDFRAVLVLGLIPLLLAAVRAAFTQPGVATGAAARAAVVAALAAALLLHPALGSLLAVALAGWGLVHRISLARGRWNALLALGLATVGFLGAGLAVLLRQPPVTLPTPPLLLRSLALSAPHLQLWSSLLVGALLLTGLLWPRLPAWERGAWLLGMLTTGLALATLRLPGILGLRLHAYLPGFMALGLAALFLAVTPGLLRWRGRWPSAALPVAVVLGALIWGGYSPSHGTPPLANLSQQLQGGGTVASIDLPGQAERVLLAAPKETLVDLAPSGASLAAGLGQAWADGWRPYVIDRLSELQVSWVMLPKEFAQGGTLATLNAAGYTQSLDVQGTTLFHRNGGGGSSVSYSGLALGAGSATWASIFPTLAVAPTPDMTALSVDELARYPLVVFAGAQYRSQKDAEATVLALVQRGVRVVVDLQDFAKDPLSGRPFFLGTAVDPITLTSLPPLVASDGKPPLNLGQLPKTLRVWDTFTLRGLTQDTLDFRYLGDRATAVGVQATSAGPVTFVGLNLAGYAEATGDPGAVQALETVLGLKARATPNRGALAVTNQRRSGEVRSTFAVPSGPVEVLLPISAATLPTLSVDGKLQPLHLRHGLADLWLPGGFHTVTMGVAGFPWLAYGGWGLMALAGGLWWTLLARSGRRREERGKFVA